jgi:hypothetical protein
MDSMDDTEAIKAPAASRVIWRFFSSDDSGWRWQQLATDGGVLAESPQAYDEYEACLAGARDDGYCFESSQGRITRPGNSHYPRW